MCTQRFIDEAVQQFQEYLRHIIVWPNNTTVVFCIIHQGNTKSQGMLRYRKQAHLKTSTGKFTDLYFFKLWEDSKSVEGAEKVGIWTSLNMHIQNGFHIMCHLFFPFYLLAIIRTRWIDCVISLLSKILMPQYSSISVSIHLSV